MVLLECKKLTIQFGGIVAVKEIDFKIQKGEIVGLIGPNGSGKTTLFNLITGIYHPNNGEVFFNDKSITGKIPAEISQMGIARTFQNSRLFLKLSVLDNVLSGMYYKHGVGILNAIFRKKWAIRKMSYSIEQAKTLLNYFSEEMGKDINKKAGDLPLADRRRLEICRALANEPDLLLLDEPSSGMSPEETQILMDDILRIKRKNPEIGIAIIEHDLTVIKKITPQRVVVMNYGEKIAEGPFREVVEITKVKQAYLGGSKV
jgi:branched-chain amino acid transport system ATP-binding protein